MAGSKVTVLRPKTSSSRPHASTVPPQSPTPKKQRKGGWVGRNRKTGRLLWSRLLLVWGALLAGSAALAFHLYQLQIVQGDEFMEKAQQQQMVYMRPYVPRRPIVDRHGNVLATDRLVYKLFAHPKLFKIPPEEIATRLAPILERNPERLLEAFQRRASGIPIAHRLPEERADQVAALGLDGLELIRQYSRLYPQQELAAEIVGYVDVDHKGQSGLEFTQQDLLERNVRTLRLNRAGNGALMPDHIPEGFMNFDDQRLQLTLDMRLQRVARSILKQQVTNYQAKRGAVIVMDVRDGSILALVTEPTFDPNEYSRYNINLFKNWTITDLYEPGSTFKPINIAIALDKGVINENTILADPGRVQIERWEIRNHDFERRGGRGRLNLSETLIYSSNVAMVNLVRKMRVQDYYEALQNLKMNQRMGIELPGESAGQLKSPQQFFASPVEAATSSFGQGFSLTPLKLVQLHAALANGGKLVTPHVVNAMIDGEGNVMKRLPLPKPERIFSEETTNIVMRKMEDTINSSAGATVKIPNYRLGGKSGTAQKASPAGGYYSDLKIVSFIAALPVEDPKYVVLAVLDEPKGDNAFGSTVAGPVVRAVSEALIAIEGIPPSQ
ncbi:penicillin-binding protein 2 [Spirulina subsalsa FACHB-351]|uniref:Penicillin-binding protein 2 n=1 Tax=Spirulina subsalsa FACHB-351 TaxID=234711 RepID=A0ABT3L369_9CYAN|nr:penicillin-binding protein 2 [Spirulina subsalsa]MCW6035933.1 penicillin-binding protein 2 [Spirulina subsalsa FACHB-351]